MSDIRHVNLDHVHPATGEHVEHSVAVPSYNSAPIHPNPSGRVYTHDEWRAARKAGIYTGDRADEHRGPLIYGNAEQLVKTLEESVSDLTARLSATRKVLDAVHRNIRGEHP